jgi:DNA polymerase I-like protein with 3'-5' exonuclease and polymerase domains
MRQQQTWPVVLHDLVRAKRNTLFPEVIVLETEYRTKHSVEDTRGDILADARAAGFVIYDIETEGANALDPARSTIICIGFGSTPRRATTHHWSHPCQQLTRELLEDETVVKVGQNSENFDQPYLEKKGFAFKGLTADTMQMFHLTNPDLDKNLAFLGSVYGDRPNWKGKNKGDLFLYNAQDVDMTCRAFVNLRRELKDLGLDNLYWNVVNPLQPVLRRISDRGLKKDEDKAMMWATRLTQAADQKERDLGLSLGWPGLNVNSNPQLKELFYKRLGLPVQYKRDSKTREMRPTCDKEAIKTLCEISNNPTLHAVNDVRSARNMVSSVLEVPTDDNGYIHPRLRSDKAANGRLNCVEPNGQNIPLVLREVYTADTPEHVLFELDWSQIEQRVAMVLSGDEVGLSLFVSGQDIHIATYAEAFGVSMSSVTPEQRNLAKFIVYGLGYGRGEASIAKANKLDPKKVAEFVRGYSARFKRYWDFREECLKKVADDYYLANFMGRRRWWFTRQITEMYNFLPSSTAADMMYQIILQAEAQLPKEATIRLSIHDAILVNSPKDVAREAFNALRDIMQRMWPEIVNASSRPEVVKRFYPNGWYCPVDGHVGNNWKACKKGDKALEQHLGITA